MTTKPFFYICVGLTLSLPLFYLDLAVVEFFEKGRTASIAAASDDGSVDSFGRPLDVVGANYCVFACGWVCV